MSVYRNDKLDDVRECVSSLQVQTLRNFDVYIQYDGVISTGVKQFFMNLNDNRFHVYNRELNCGLAQSMNDLLDIVLKRDYDYIARMDADDVSLSDRFAKQVQYLDTHRDIDIVGGFIEEFFCNEKVHVVYPLIHEEMKNSFPRRNPLAHVTVLFRRSYFEKAGLYPIHTDKDEDTLLWLNGFLSGCYFANIPSVLVKVRVSSDFYNRRNGFDKSYGDFKNRCLIIQKLGLSWNNYFYIFVRFFIFSLPFPWLTKLAYKGLRK